MFYFMWDLMARSLSALPSLLLVSLCWLSIQLSELITARAKDETLRALLNRFDGAVLTAVRETEQVHVIPIKKANPGVSLSAADRAAASAHAAQTVRACLGAKGWLDLSAAFGLSSDELERVLGGRVEAAVYDLRAAISAHSASHQCRQRSPENKFQLRLSERRKYTGAIALGVSRRAR